MVELLAVLCVLGDKIIGEEISNESSMTEKSILSCSHRLLLQNQVETYENPTFMMGDDPEEGEQAFKDEGYIELLLRVMAGMCDGQNKVIQVGSILKFSMPCSISHSYSLSHLGNQFYPLSSLISGLPERTTGQFQVQQLSGRSHHLLESDLLPHQC